MVTAGRGVAAVSPGPVAEQICPPSLIPVYSADWPLVVTSSTPRPEFLRPPTELTGNIPQVFAVQVSAVVCEVPRPSLSSCRWDSRGRSQQEWPSYLMEEVSGRSLPSPSPPLHHLDGLRHHADGGGEGHQEQQVWRTDSGHGVLAVSISITTPDYIQLAKIQESRM